MIPASTNRFGWSSFHKELGFFFFGDKSRLGSFGHFQASKSGVHKGGLDQSLVKAGFVATQISVTTLNLEVVRALAKGSNMQPAIHVTRGPNKYLEIWDLPDDQEIELPLNSMHQPVDEGARTFTGFLGTIARKPYMCLIKYLDWKAMPKELKEECWCTVKTESDKSKDRRSKQDEIHTGGSCGYAMHAAKKATTNGHLVEHAVVFQILHTRIDGSAVNPIMKEKMEKMKELLVDPKNQLQSSDTSGSIAWSTDDVFAKVMGKERKGRIRGVEFGPTPSGQSSKTALMDSEIQSSQARDNEVAQLKASLATMEEKLVGFDKMKEKVSQFEEMEQRMDGMLQQMQQFSTQCNQV
nr:hypothetical protein CFP56_41229 [Quercus suber]